MTNSEKGFEPSVLVVDDEKRIRDACHKMLTLEGFQVDRAATGREGLKKIQERHFDIILLDLMMPGLTGFNVLEEVKGLHPDTVIIVITGYATLEHSIEAMKKGAFDFLSKPFSPHDLKLVVTKALEHIRTLNDIAQEKSRMRVLLNYLADGVLTTDSSRRVVLVNPAFRRLLGYTGGEVVNQPVDRLVKDEKILAMIETALSDSAEETTELVEEICPEGWAESEKGVISARCVPFRDRIGRRLGTVTVLRDITMDRKMQELKNEFVSMVSHEIRNPLNSVLMQLKVILDGLAGDITDKQKEILDRASERIKALNSLSSELLDLARIESGLITQEKEPVFLNDLLVDQIAFHSARAVEKNIDLELAPLQDLPPIMANRQNMEEVLSNLITNAIKYTPPGGRVSVGAGLDDDQVVLQVKDSGFGLSPEDQKRVFERFYRVKNEQTRHITGTGLGLPIVKDIVEAHQGVVKVESEPGQGSTFLVYLPLIDIQIRPHVP